MWRASISNRPFDRMGERFAPLVDPNHFMGRSAFDIKRHNKDVPAANVIKKGKLFELQLAVPGYAKDELDVTLKDNILVVSGKKNYPSEEVVDKEFILEEFDYDSFERCFRLSSTIAHEKIEANYDNGILRISFEDVPEEEERAYQKVKVL